MPGMEKYNYVNEFDVGVVLGLTDDAISGAKIAGGFTDYVKFMVKKHCYNGIKIEGYILVVYFCDRL